MSIKINKSIASVLITIVFVALFSFMPTERPLADTANPTPGIPHLALNHDEQNKPYVRLTWNPPENAPTVDGYNIYRIKIENTDQVTSSLNDYEKIKESITTPYYEDYGVEYGCTYHYVITALYGSFESDGSELYNPGTLSVSPPIDMIFATERISLNGNALITGTIGTNSNKNNSITFNNHKNIIVGDLYYGPQADWDPSNVTGKIYNLSSMRDYQLPQFPAFPEDLPEGKIGGNFFGNGRIIKNDGHFNTIAIKNNEKLTIRAKDTTRIIRVKDLDIKGSLALDINSNGKVILYVDDSLDISGEINLNGDPSKVTIYYAGNDELKLNGNSKLSGSIYASNADVKFSGNSFINGFIITGGEWVKSSGNTDARISVIYAPYAHVDFSGNADLTGVVVAREISLTGNGNITYENSENVSMNQFEWGSIPSTPSGNIIKIPIPLDQLPPEIILDFSSKVKTVVSDDPNGSSSDGEEYLDQIRFLAGDYIPIEISIIPSFTIINHTIKLDLALRDPDNDFDVNDEFMVVIEPSKTVVTKNGIPFAIPELQYPYDTISIPEVFTPGDQLRLDYTIKAIPAKNKVNYDSHKKYVVTFDIVEMIVMTETGEQILYTPPEDYVKKFTAELIIVDPKVMR